MVALLLQLGTACVSSRLTGQMELRPANLSDPFWTYPAFELPLYFMAVGPPAQLLVMWSPYVLVNLLCDGFYGHPLIPLFLSKST